MKGGRTTCDDVGSIERETTYENVTLQIWDTAGQERFRCMVPMYMRNSAAAIIMYDVTNKQSFDDVDKWSEEIRRCCGIPDPLLILLGTRSCDLCDERRVSTAEGSKKARQIDARFYEVTIEKPITFSLVLEELCIELLSGPSSSDETLMRSESSSDVVLLSSRNSSTSLKDSGNTTKCCGFL
ncbi:hypothetical protein KIN20_010231 [Parelaphostrongylus tenuis]|uniref:Ras family protein n=1 Tax=Parelaphostrongylus tenuis TaxID=148309 RepID=A0AAD5QIP7_PARTN|nr:hypothetical protein KIN20_010231 [Parelaphostrongylus tenuis]